MIRYCCGFFFMLLGIFSWAPDSLAAAEMHLKFHSGAVVDGQSFITGSLNNRGDADIAHGYVVVTVLDAQCRPVKSILQSFDRMEPGQEQRFRLPVEGRLKRYRLASVVGFDDMGFNVVTVNETEPMFKLREPEEQALCAQARSRFGQGGRVDQ